MDLDPDPERIRIHMSCSVSGTRRENCPVFLKKSIRKHQKRRTLYSTLTNVQSSDPKIKEDLNDFADLEI